MCDGIADCSAGSRGHYNAADMSVATTQEARRCSLLDDSVAYLKEKYYGETVLAELERLCVT